MFDWGATRISDMLEAHELNFLIAKDKVVKSATFFRASDFIERFRKGNPYKKVVIFVDNSGADIVLGIVPLARYLVETGSTVILAANTTPAVNDVTVSIGAFFPLMYLKSRCFIGS
jgi:type II pantothenate kinase